MPCSAEMEPSKAATMSCTMRLTVSRVEGRGVHRRRDVVVDVAVADMAEGEHARMPGSAGGAGRLRGLDEKSATARAGTETSCLIAPPSRASHFRQHLAQAPERAGLRLDSAMSRQRDEALLEGRAEHASSRLAQARSGPDDDLDQHELVPLGDAGAVGRPCFSDQLRWRRPRSARRPRSCRRVAWAQAAEVERGAPDRRRPSNAVADVLRPRHSFRTAAVMMPSVPSRADEELLQVVARVVLAQAGAGRSRRVPSGSTTSSPSTRSRVMP